MVGKCLGWIAVADELGLDRKSRRGLVVLGQQIGFEMAVDEKSQSGESTADKVVRRETVLRIRKALAAEQHRDVADEIINDLESGKTTPDEAIQIMKMYLEQIRESESNSIL